MAIKITFTIETEGGILKQLDVVKAIAALSKLSNDVVSEIIDFEPTMSKIKQCQPQ